ncbi:Gfo/Idh/MocA family oxidoreductase [Candidatus Daviesbacteria bacterium]|nr:Gfo/Idh/MocA family oxidoreductase [Candidatus Daviesbacteria bacterium]
MKYIIVGFGNIGHKRQAILGPRCIATVDPDPRTKADFADSSQVPRSLIDECRAVIVAVPRQPKLELVEYWLLRSKHVLVEKPVVITKTQAKRLQSIARKNKVIWYTAYNHRFEPNIARIKKLLAKKTIGKLYHGQIAYGFGNVKELKKTWRETGYGVLDEVGCHLVDFAHWFYGYRAEDFRGERFGSNELSVWDYCTFGTTDGKLIAEASWVTWKNSFSIEFFGSLGSIHLSGLCKWGTSRLTIRTRIFPAGVPIEKIFVEKGPDQTWTKDLKYFENQVRQNKTTYDNDLVTSQALVNIAKSLDQKLKNEQVYKKLKGL